MKYSREKWRVLMGPTDQLTSPIRQATGKNSQHYLDALDGDGYEGEHPGDNRALFNLGNGARHKRRTLTQ